MADKLIPPWKNRPTPTSRVNRSALSTTRERGKFSFPAPPDDLRIPRNEGCGRKWTTSPASGDKGPFLPLHFPLRPRIRADQRFRDFAPWFFAVIEIPSSSRFKNPTLPSFSLAPISLIFRLVGKGCPNGRIILFLGSWVFGAEDWTNRVGDFDEGSNCGDVSFLFLFFFFLFSFVVLPSSFLFSRGIQESMEMLCNPMLDSIYCGDLSWHDEFHSQLSTYNFPLLRFNLYFRIIIRIHEWWI